MSITKGPLTVTALAEFIHSFIQVTIENKANFFTDLLSHLTHIPPTCLTTKAQQYNIFYGSWQLGGKAREVTKGI